MKPKLFYVEDEADLGNVTRKYLELMDFSVDLFTSAHEALDAFRKDPFSYQIVILDIQLPDMDGFTLAEKILQIHPEVFLLFLTAKTEKMHRLKGFTIGAVDYLTKPFDIDELVLQIQNLLRPRINHLTDYSNSGTMAVGDLILQKSMLTLTLSDGKVIDLTQREAELLEYLYLHKGKIVKRKEILLSVWGDDNYFVGRSMDVFISRLRKLTKNSSAVKIENVYGVGYIFRLG